MPRKGIMWVYPFSEKRFEKWLEEDGYCYVQPKLNGLHLIWDSLSDKLLSSQGNEKFSLPHVVEALRGDSRINFEGEAYIHKMPLQNLRSIVNRKNDLHPDFKKVEFHIFDFKPEFAQATFEERWFYLDAIFKHLNFTHSPLKLVDTRRVTTRAEVEILLTSYLECGYEGIVLKKASGLWEPKRSTSLMKIKPSHQDIYEVVDLIEGTGKYEGTLGALEVVGSSGIQFHVGSFQMDDFKRDEIWSDRLAYVGGKALVKYTELTVDGKPTSGICVELSKED